MNLNRRHRSHRIAPRRTELRRGVPRCVASGSVADAAAPEAEKRRRSVSRHVPHATCRVSRAARRHRSPSVISAIRRPSSDMHRASCSPLMPAPARWRRPLTAAAAAARAGFSGRYRSGIGAFLSAADIAVAGGRRAGATRTAERAGGLTTGDTGHRPTPTRLRPDPARPRRTSPDPTRPHPTPPDRGHMLP